MFNWVKGLRQFWLAAIICVVLLALSSTTAHAQTFSIANLTSGSGTQASFPNMVVDSKGNTYLAWVDTAKGGIVVSSQFDGTKFNQQFTVTTPVLPAFQPQMAVYDFAGATPVVEIAWASVNPASTATPPVYDVYASRLNPGDLNFSPPSLVSGTSGPVPLADTPRLAFDHAGNVNVVWGQHDVLISQSQDGKTFPTVTSLVPAAVPPNPQPALDTGGPRIIADAANDIFVAWTDEATKNAPGSYCIPGTPTTAALGGNLFINETLAGSQISAAQISAATTHNLSQDWKGADPEVPQKFPNGFFGCSYDNLSFFIGTGGLVHVVWSDDSPIEDVLTSQVKTGVTNSDFTARFSFPFNLATSAAASPQVAVDKNGSFFMVWSGGPIRGTNSDGIFFIRSDDNGETFTPDVNIASPSAIAPAYPQVAVDSNGGVSVAWEQADQPISIQSDGTSNNTFNVFFAHSTDKGNTFPTVVQASTNSSAMCFKDPSSPTTPDTTTCGTVQIGMDANSNPDMAWVNQATGAAVSDIDFATTNPLGPLTSDFGFSVSPTLATAQAGQALNFTVSTTAIGTFANPITLACNNFMSSSSVSAVVAATQKLTCTLPSGPTSAGGSATVSVAIPADFPSPGGQFTFTINGTGINGTGGTTTHRATVTATVGNPGSVSPASQSITGVNSSATFNVAINPSFFSGTVTFSCLDTDTNSAPPSWLGCSFNPPQLDPTQGTTDVLTVTEKSTPMLISGMFVSAPFSHVLPADGRPMAWTLALGTLCLMSMIVVALGRRQALSSAVLMRGFLVMTLTIALAAGLVSCGGSTSSPSTTGTTSTAGTSGSGGTSGTGGTGTGGTGGTGGGTGGTGGTGGATPVTVHVAVMAQSASTGTVTLGTVTITAQ